MSSILEQRMWVQSNLYSYLDNPVLVSRRPLKINYRCFACGDSKTNRNKRRGYVLEGRKGIYCYCHRCGYSASITRTLDDYFPHLKDDFVFSVFSNQSRKKSEPEEFKSNAVLTKAPEDPLKFMAPLSSLSGHHPVRLYMASRKVPEKHFDDIWYTDKWYRCANAMNPEIYPESYNDQKHPRLVFTLRDFGGNIVGIQGRKLRDQDRGGKYITIKKTEDTPKIWGLNLVDPNKTVLLFEGIVDAMFFSNACAILGATSSQLSDLLPNRVWVLDDEPHKPETMHHYEKLIDSGEQVVIWDRLPFRGKDANEKVLNGQSVEYLESYIRENTLSDLMAKLRLNQWRKC